MPTAANTDPVPPFAVSIADARRISGLSRSELYRRLAAGKISAVKGGSRTLVILDSLLRHLRSLPAATFRAPPGHRSAQ
jgi:hypothetical protein